MKKLLSALLFLTSSIHVISQENVTVTREKLLAELSANGCKCVDSLSIANKSKEEVAQGVSKCISEQVSAFQLASQLLSIDDLQKKSSKKDGKKRVNISINTNEQSDEFKKYYYEMERYMMENCSSVKEKISNYNKLQEKSVSSDSVAKQLYLQGNSELEKENYVKAIEYYKKAVAIDSMFAFAWDNIGLCYRKLSDYDEAINAYNKSLSIQPAGLMPLQNIAVAYQYKKEYDNAISAYEKMATVDPNNPEVYFGIGKIYVAYKNELEKGLDNMCKAYNLYVQQKSPYRTDAEKLIQAIYVEMKKQGNEDKFSEILKANNIRTN